MGVECPVLLRISEREFCEREFCGGETSVIWSQQRLARPYTPVVSRKTE